MAQDMNPTSTFGLLERAQAGDEEAFASLFRKYSGRLAVLIRYKLGAEMRNRIEVEDVLQESFLYASRRLSDFDYRRPGSFMSWLARIADHVIIDAVRHQQRQKRHPDASAGTGAGKDRPGAEPADSTTPSRILARKEQFEHVVEILDQLPDDYRAVILLAKLEGLTTQEIAERLTRSRAAVTVLLHRATQRLKELTESGAQP